MTWPYPGDMSKLAVCPGSFDPVTRGHLDVFRAAGAAFDRVRVVVIHNPDKPTGLLAGPARVGLLRAAIAEAGLDNVDVDLYAGALLADYCREVGAAAIVKGIRGASDLDYELPMSAVNADLAGIPTLFVPTRPEHSHISSSLVRQVIGLGGDVAAYVPLAAAAALQQESARFGVSGT